LQQADRTRGLRIDGGTTWVPGDLVRAAGRLATSDGERRLIDVEAQKVGSGAPPAPLAAGVAAVGGAAPDAYTPGLSSAGAYNIGLLVRTIGRVGAKGSGWFEISDGSGATARVYSSVVPPDGAFVGVTGVASVESGRRVIRTRTSADVSVY